MQVSIRFLASADRLLVASDFDGTVSRLMPTPAQARADEQCLAALRSLSSLPRTSIAVISGRPLAWLRPALSSLPQASLFGSHGAEHESWGTPLDADSALTVAQLQAAVGAVGRRWTDTHLECKPFGVALHYRSLNRNLRSALVAEMRELASSHANVRVLLGTMVVELCVSSRTKGDAIRQAQSMCGATQTVFLGDDPTDEDAFRELGTEDLSIKVGPGDSVAVLRVAGVRDVAQFLEAISHARARWQTAQHY